MKDRIKKLRKSLDLTQQEFAERIGVKRNTIGQYEIGRNEPIDTVINLICREFNVREEWLRTGNGEMFNPKPSDTLERLAYENGFSKTDYAIVEKIVSLRPQERKALFGKIFDFLHEIDAMLSDTDPFSPALPASTPAASPRKETIEELEAAYEKSLGIVSKTGSPASSTTGGDARKRSEAV